MPFKQTGREELTTTYIVILSMRVDLSIFKSDDWLRLRLGVSRSLFEIKRVLNLFSRWRQIGSNNRSHASYN